MQKSTDDWRSQPRGPYKTKLESDIAAALKAYRQGEKVESACAQFNIYKGRLYWWINRLGITRRGRRAEYRKPRSGRPISNPTVYECQGCGAPLHQELVRKRIRYCCDECRAAGYKAYVEAQRDKKRMDGDVKFCQAPGCGTEFWGDNVYCSKKCADAAIKARSEARKDVLRKLAHLPTNVIAERLGLKTKIICDRMHRAGIPKACRRSGRQAA